MLDVYAFATPNSVKVPLALEEMGLEYRLHAVNVRKGEQKAAAFVAINPNGKVPVLVDPNGPGGSLTLSESAREPPGPSGSTSTGTFPLGLIATNAGAFCSPLRTFTACRRYSRPISSSASGTFTLLGVAKA